jgi:selenocysteine lyase/cysteine desulfurase
VDLDEVTWTDPPDREEAGSPNVVGAVALHAAIDELQVIGWPAVAAHDAELAARLRSGLAGIDSVHLLGLGAEEIAAYRAAVLAGDRRSMPGAVRASAGINTSDADIDRFLAAVAAIASGEPAPVTYQQDPASGDYWPDGDIAGWSSAERALGASCARG